MGRKSSQTASDNESGRDSRLKLILLFVALVLVAGYAAWMTDVMDGISRGLAMFGTGLPILPAAGAIAAVAVLVFAILAIRRRRPAKAKSKPMEGADLGAAHAGRRDFLKAPSGQIDALLRLMQERLLVLVNHPERLARIGDDEFAVIQPEVGGARHAEIYARRVLETCKDAMRPGGTACAPERQHRRRGLSGERRGCRQAAAQRFGGSSCGQG